MSKDGINSKDFLIGTLIGGIVGATTALFLAPKLCKQLRDDLNTQAHALQEKTDRLTTDAKERGTEYVTIAQDKTSALSQLVAEQSNQILDKVKDIKERAAGKANKVKSEAEDAAADLASEASDVADEAKVRAQEAKSEIEDGIKDVKEKVEQSTKG